MGQEISIRALLSDTSSAILIVRRISGMNSGLKQTALSSQPFQEALLELQGASFFVDYKGSVILLTPIGVKLNSLKHIETMNLFRVPSY